ncbi:MAG: hypothetical protein MHMPM18_001394 [Marteilia pararefringens]
MLLLILLCIDLFSTAATSESRNGAKMPKFSHIEKYYLSFNQDDFRFKIFCNNNRIKMDKGTFFCTSPSSCFCTDSKVTKSIAESYKIPMARVYDNNRNGKIIILVFCSVPIGALIILACLTGLKNRKNVAEIMRKYNERIKSIKDTVMSFKYIFDFSIFSFKALRRTAETRNC